MASDVTMMIGIPGSGKSTWAADMMEQDTVRINRDEIRMQVFGVEFDKQFEVQVKIIALDRYRKALEDKKFIILDNCNLTKSQRYEWIAIAKEYGASITAVYMDIDYKEAFARQHNRERQVPQDVIRSMYIALESPMKSEGFGDIIRVDSTGSWKHL